MGNSNSWLTVYDLNDVKSEILQALLPLSGKSWYWRSWTSLDPDKDKNSIFDKIAEIIISKTTFAQKETSEILCLDSKSLVKENGGKIRTGNNIIEYYISKKEHHLAGAEARSENNASFIEANY